MNQNSDNPESLDPAIIDNIAGPDLALDDRIQKVVSKIMANPSLLSKHAAKIIFMPHGMLKQDLAKALKMKRPTAISANIKRQTAKAISVLNDDI